MNQSARYFFDNFETDRRQKIDSVFNLKINAKFDVKQVLKIIIPITVDSGGEYVVYGVPLAFSVNLYLRVGGVTLITKSSAELNITMLGT